MTHSQVVSISNLFKVNGPVASRLVCCFFTDMLIVLLFSLLRSKGNKG
jgi:hypothetical protein